MIVTMWIRYRKEGDRGVILTRIYGDRPVADVPDAVAGMPVIAIGEYCFSEKEPPADGNSEVPARIDAASEHTGSEAAPDELDKAIGRGEVRSLSGDYITEVSLPATVESIGNLCFYGCRALRTVELYNADLSIGSDAFMNCHKLSRFILHAQAKDRTSLRRILLQRTEATYVRFDDAAVYFPAFSEHYDLIGPAHIFELAIDGQGLRARQCFEDEVFRPEAYDAMFEQARMSEDTRTLCRMAAARLQFADRLPTRSMYETYLGEHMEVFAEDAVRDRDLSLVLALSDRGVLSPEHIKTCLLCTTKERWIEGTRMLLAVSAAPGSK